MWRPRGRERRGFRSRPWGVRHPIPVPVLHGAGAGDLSRTHEYERTFVEVVFVESVLELTARPLHEYAVDAEVAFDRSLRIVYLDFGKINSRNESVLRRKSQCAVVGLETVDELYLFHRKSESICVW